MKGSPIMNDRLIKQAYRSEAFEPRSTVRADQHHMEERQLMELASRRLNDRYWGAKLPRHYAS